MFGLVKTIISFVVGIIELLLTLRFMLKFLVVNVHTPFVGWIYNTTAPLVVPFSGIIPDLKLGGFMIDFATLAALIVYVLVGYSILRIFSYVDPRYR
ncbi:MAG: YggT family protein [Parcubacteria group bacterium]